MALGGPEEGFQLENDVATFESGSPRTALGQLIGEIGGQGRGCGVGESGLTGKLSAWWSPQPGAGLGVGG